MKFKLLSGILIVICFGCSTSEVEDNGKGPLIGKFQLNIETNYDRYFELKVNGEYSVHDSLIEGIGKCLVLECLGNFSNMGDSILIFSNSKCRDHVSGCADSMLAWRNDGDGKFKIRNLTDSSFEFTQIRKDSSLSPLWKTYRRIN